MNDYPTVAGMHKEPMMGKFNKYEVEDAMRAIIRVDEIGKDKDLMKQVMILAKKHETSMVDTGLVKKVMNKRKG